MGGRRKEWSRKEGRKRKEGNKNSNVVSFLEALSPTIQPMLEGFT